MTTRLYQVSSARFEAARRLPDLPAGHRARRLHGHSFLARALARIPAGRAAFPSGETEALRADLAHCVAALDYQDLNRRLSVPSDENLARWVRARLQTPGVESVGIRSAWDQGADLDTSDHAHVWRRFRFEAAHRLPNVPPGHKCGRMHGHGFEVVLHADRDLGGDGMEIDCDRLDAAWAPLRRVLHQNCLNDLEGLENPTSEVLSAWLWERLKPALPALSRVSVHESPNTGCHYDGRRFRIWTARRFESALRLVQAPEGDAGRRLHGHGYLARLHLSAPLDQVMGWVLDYGDVKAHFEPVYRQLDHRLLNELPRLQDTDPASLALWLRAELSARITALDRIDLEDTPGHGVLLRWDESGPTLPL